MWQTRHWAAKSWVRDWFCFIFAQKWLFHHINGIAGLKAQLCWPQNNCIRRFWGVLQVTRHTETVWLLFKDLPYPCWLDSHAAFQTVGRLAQLAVALLSLVEEVGKNDVAASADGLVPTDLSAKQSVELPSSHFMHAWHKCTSDYDHDHLQPIPAQSDEEILKSINKRLKHFLFPGSI